MTKYVIACTRDRYTHRIDLGVEADSAAEAVAIAADNISDMTIWEDTDEQAVLAERFCEDLNGGKLGFEVVERLIEGDPWPAPEASILRKRSDSDARAIVAYLYEAFPERGERPTEGPLAKALELADGLFLGMPERHLHV